MSTGTKSNGRPYALATETTYCESHLGIFCGILLKSQNEERLVYPIICGEGDKGSYWNLANMWARVSKDVWEARLLSSYSSLEGDLGPHACLGSLRASA